MAGERSNLLTGLVTTGVVALIIVWGVTSLTNEDPLWFVHRFDARAESFVLYWDGLSHTVSPGDVGYEAMMDAFAAAMAYPSGYKGRVGFSEENRTTYQTRFCLLEVQFAEPVQVHMRHPCTRAATFIIPLNGTHAASRRAFSFPGTVPYTSSPLNIAPENFDALYAAVEAVVSLTLAK